MKVLSGVHPFGSYSGEIFIDGELQKFNGIRDSEKAGIAIIYQELALVPNTIRLWRLFRQRNPQRLHH